MLPLYKPSQDQGAKCSECPLRDQSWVPCEPATAIPRAKVYLVGDQVGKAEVVHHRPFSGETGRFLNRVFDLFTLEAGLSRDMCHITNSTLCLPLKHMEASEWRAAGEACKPRLARELSEAPAGSVVIAMGAKVVEIMTGKAPLKDWRGFQLDGAGDFAYLNERGVTIIPTFHPAWINSTPSALPVFLTDFANALKVQAGLLKPMPWPRISIEEDAVAWAILEEIEKAGWVGTDVETGGEDPYLSRLLCVGLAHEHGAVSLRWPIMDRSLADYVRHILRSTKVKKVFHNGNYDLISLNAWQVECSGNDFDTLVAHRIVAPQAPHDLGFVASMEFYAERWKSQHKVGDDRKGSKRWAHADSDPGKFAALRYYNAKDALMTARLRPALLRRMK